MTSYVGVDVAKWQPVNLPWAAWVAGGLSVAVVQITHGTVLEPRGYEHTQAALAAGVPNVAAYHFLQPGNIAKQSYIFTFNLKRFDFKFAALDVEAEPGQPPPSAADVVEWCERYDADLNGLPLVLYGNYSALVPILNAHPELKRYGIWWAQYANKMTPPAGLQIVGWQKLGDVPGFVGRLPPYTGAIDLTVWYEIPGQAVEPPTLTPAERSAIGQTASNLRALAGQLEGME